MFGRLEFFGVAPSGCECVSNEHDLSLASADNLGSSWILGYLKTCPHPVQISDIDVFCLITRDPEVWKPSV